jgi:hypothetical protein
MAGDAGLYGYGTLASNPAITFQSVADIRAQGRLESTADILWSILADIPGSLETTTNIIFGTLAIMKDGTVRFIHIDTITAVERQIDITAAERQISVATSPAQPININAIA